MAKTFKPSTKEVNAVQWNGSNIDEIKSFYPGATATAMGRSLHVSSPKVAILMNTGDWLVEHTEKEGDKQVKSIIAMNEKDFAAKYEEKK